MRPSTYEMFSVEERNLKYRSTIVIFHIRNVSKISPFSHFRFLTRFCSQFLPMMIYNHKITLFGNCKNQTDKRLKENE